MLGDADVEDGSLSNWKLLFLIDFVKHQHMDGAAVYWFAQL